MNVFDILREKLEKQREDYDYDGDNRYLDGMFTGMYDGVVKCIEILNRIEEEYSENDNTDYAVNELYAFWEKWHDKVENNGWIPCSERLPKVEEEVFILAKRKRKGEDVMYITTTAMYEDGTVREYDSCWIWEELEGEWDEEDDCYIIPEGWWENRHYNPDEVYNNVVDDEVIAWQPLPEPYRGEE